MRALATYIMRGRVPAILVTAGMALSALLLMLISWPLSYLSGASVVLVTLVHGPKEGLINVAGATLLIGLIIGIMVGQPMVAPGYAIFQWIPVWILAVVLYQQRSLVLVLFVIGIMGFVLISMAYLFMDSPANWWYSHFIEQVIPAMESAGIKISQNAEMLQQFQQVATMMTGILVASSLFGYAISIFIGRWWQAVRLRPGAFGEEFRQIRIGKIATVLITVLALAGLLAPDSIAEVSNNLILPLALLFLFQGIAVVHSVARDKSNRTWLILMYLALSLFMFFPFGVLFIVMLGLVDNGINIRALVARRK